MTSLRLELLLFSTTLIEANILTLPAMPTSWLYRYFHFDSYVPHILVVAPGGSLHVMQSLLFSKSMCVILYRQSIKPDERLSSLRPERFIHLKPFWITELRKRLYIADNLNISKWLNTMNDSDMKVSWSDAVIQRHDSSS